MTKLVNGIVDNVQKIKYITYEKYELNGIVFYIREYKNIGGEYVELSVTHKCCTLVEEYNVKDAQTLIAAINVVRSNHTLDVYNEVCKTLSQ